MTPTTFFEMIGLLIFATLLKNGLTYKSFGKPAEAKVMYPTKFIEYAKEITYFDLKILKIEHFFQPVDSNYLEEKLKTFDFKFKDLKIHRNSDPNNLPQILTTPSKIDTSDIYLNSTHYFLCNILNVSYMDEYKIRNLIYEAFLHNEIVNKFIISAETKKNYLEKRKIEQFGVKLQYLELFVTALVLNVCIYIYDEVLDHWLFFHKDWPNYKNLDMKQEKCIYLAKPLKNINIYPVLQVHK
ncbi:uncharacterized protein LOC126903009 isoform X2 [Daktulosphaira vitifoliae]|uniref:uncharacterized protein LOC126903009 isoform X2 n=1 Tax=Daktulosphaira vitifoliae TaxID=58002 RepID=UPI0021AACCBA|nr:uncharacterized protein LOC126903009 isoform X2 [Daktulosphaira vitifoliae]